MNDDSRKIISLLLKHLVTLIVAIPVIIFLVFILQAPSYERYALQSDYVSEIVHAVQRAEQKCNKGSSFDIKEIDDDLNQAGHLKKSIHIGKQSDHLPQTFDPSLKNGNSYYLSITGKEKEDGNVFFSASQAEYIDRKLDDGFPNNGRILAAGDRKCLDARDNQVIYRDENSEECAFLYFKLKCEIK